MEYKLLEVEFKGTLSPKYDLKEIQTAVNDYAKSGWKVNSITPIARTNGITEKIIITLERGSS